MSLTKRIAVALALVGIVVLVWVEPLAAQCAMCRTALTESVEGQQLASGFNSAILFLLGAPYLVFGTLAASLWFSRRKSRAGRYSQ
jgi:hypothetical protein